MIIFAPIFTKAPFHLIDAVLRVTLITYQYIQARLATRAWASYPGLVLSMLCLFAVYKTDAQQNDSSHQVTIELTADVAYHIKTDTSEYDKFVGHAVFIQGTDTLYCDSLLKNTATKNIEAFGDVKIHQAAGTRAESDYLKYTSAKKLAFNHF